MLNTSQSPSQTRAALQRVTISCRDKQIIHSRLQGLIIQLQALQDYISREDHPIYVEQIEAIMLKHSQLIDAALNPIVGQL